MIRAIALGSAALIALAPAAVPLAAAQAPAAAPLAAAQASSTRSAEVLSNDEVAIAELDPAGLPVDARLISRTTSSGGDQRTIIDPAPTTNVSYLDRRGAPETTADAMLIEVGGEGTTTVLTEAVFDKPMPVALHAQYAVDGAVVSAERVPGAAGGIAATYTLTNTSAEVRRVSYTDAGGQRHSEKLPVFVPFAGTVTITLPPSADLLSATGAVRATDRGGSTVLRYDVLLAPPMGEYQERITVRWSTDEGSTPEVVVRVAPVTGAQNPAVGFADGLLASAEQANAGLADGLAQIDGAAAAVAAGAAALADGTGALAAGTAGFADGLDAAAAGAQDAADGQAALAGALDAAQGGAAASATGAAELAAGLASIDSGLAALSGPDGLPRAAREAGVIGDAAAALADVVGSAADPQWLPPQILPQVPPPAPEGGPPGDGTCDDDADDDGRIDDPITDIDCVPTLVQALRGLAVGTDAAADVAAESLAALAAGADDVRRAGTAVSGAGKSAGRAAAAAAALAAQLCVPPTISVQQCAALAGIAQDAGAAARSSLEAGTALTAAGAALTDAGSMAAALAVVLPVQHVVVETAATASAAVGAGMRSGDPGDPGIVEALDLLHGGLESAAAAAAALSTGTAAGLRGADALAEGTQGLADGLDTAAAGSQVLADGTGRLAAGLGAAAAGADDLGAATAGAAAGAADLAAGADRLRTQGTAGALDSAVEASADTARATAYLDATSARASDALPYGAPDGAVGNAAYILTMPATRPDSGSSGWAVAAVAVLALAALGGALLKRAR